MTNYVELKNRTNLPVSITYNNQVVIIPASATVNTVDPSLITFPLPNGISVLSIGQVIPPTTPPATPVGFNSATLNELNTAIQTGLLPTTPNSGIWLDSDNYLRGGQIP